MKQSFRPAPLAAILLLISCAVSFRAHGSRPLEMAAEIQIDTATGVLRLLEDFGLLPAGFHAEEASAAITVSASGPVSAPRCAGSLRLEFARASPGNLTGDLRAQFTVSDGMLRARDVTLRVTKPIDFAVQGEVDLDLATLAGGYTATARYADTVALSAAGDLDLSYPVTLTATGNIVIEDVETLWPAIAPHFGANAPLWLVGGHLQGSLGAYYQASSGAPAVRGTASLHGTRLQGLSPDAIIGWQGSGFLLDATGALARNRAELSVVASASPGELLVGGTFLDFRETPVTFSLDALSAAPETRSASLAFSIAAGGSGLRIDAEGTAALPGGRPAVNLWCDTGILDLTRLYQDFALKIFHERAEAFSLLGSSRIHGNLSIGPGWAFNGTITADSLSADNSSNFALRHLDLLLPLGVGSATAVSGQSHGEVMPVSGARVGCASIESATVGPFAIPPLQLRPRLAFNRFELVEGLRFQLLGGEVILSSLAIDDVLAPVPRVLASGRLDSLDLEDLCRAFGLPALPGKATLSLPEITLDGEDLILSGQTRLEIFDGTIRIQDLRLTDVIGPAPLLAFSAEFDGLNLGQVTSVIPVGRMQGGIRGFAKDFQLSLDPLEPYAFDLLVETDPDARLPRKISIEAIRTVVSVGDTAKDPFPWWFNWFDRFTYGRLGMHLRLHNDIVRMEGLIQRGNRQFFLIGSGTARVNILAPPAERGWSYSQVTSSLAQRIEEIRQKGLSEVTMRRGSK